MPNSKKQFFQITTRLNDYGGVFIAGDGIVVIGNEQTECFYPGAYL